MRHSPEIGWFVKRRARGRPQSTKIAVPANVLPWMSRYSKELSMLGNDLLGWKFQEMIRGPLYARLSAGARMVELTALSQYLGSDVPNYSREEDFDYVARGLDLIMSHPIVTLRSISSSTFRLELVGLADFYQRALLEFEGRVPPARDVFGCAKDETHLYIKVRCDITREEQMAAIANVLDASRRELWGERRWTLTGDSLRSYGVLQRLDLHLFELRHGISLPRKTVAELIFDPRAVRRKRGTDGRPRTGGFSPRDLDTTDHLADMFLSEVTEPAIYLERAAMDILFKHWRTTGGQGDGRFVPSIEEVRQLPPDEYPRYR
jgi:hypothetical protein